jgi:hypothetical protein
MVEWLTLEVRASSRTGLPGSRRRSASRGWYRVRLRRRSNAARLRAGVAFAGAGLDELPLKRRASAEHGQHQTAVGRRGVRPGIAKGCKLSSLVGDRGERSEEVARRARQPGQPRHHQHVTGGARLHDTAERRAVCLGAVGHFAGDLDRSRGGEGRNVGRDGWAVCGDACIAIHHVVMMHRTCAPNKRNGINAFEFIPIKLQMHTGPSET